MRTSLLAFVTVAVVGVHYASAGSWAYTGNAFLDRIYDGIVFDVNNRASTALTITSFDVWISAGTVSEGPLQIWSGPGSWQDCNSAACKDASWTQVLDFTLPARASGSNLNGYSQSVTFDTPVEVNAGDTQGFMLITDLYSGSPEGFWGSSVGNALYSNSDLTVYWGDNVSYYSSNGCTLSNCIGYGFHQRIYYEEPTARPTTDPSPDPTSPTTKPTPSPSPSPSADPSSAPTVPSAAPSEVPTQSPSRDPTSDPSRDPTDDPTRDPTRDHTNDPTTVPSAHPTQNPIDDPTAEPTREPSNLPTNGPSDDPTTAPSEDPPADPTSDPTADVRTTDTPTSEPSLDPTAVPTTEPSFGVILTSDVPESTEGLDSDEGNAAQTAFVALNSLVGAVFLTVLYMF